VTKANDVYDQASWRATQARLLAKAGQLSDAEALARESVKFALEGDFVTAQAESLDALAEVLLAAGRKTEAVACLEQAVRLWQAKEYSIAAAAAQRRLEDARASSSENSAGPDSGDLTP
jgi:tetratricopeptide (TPR) repeat protein